MNRTWIFNGNPNGFDLPKALSEGTLKPGDTEPWRVTKQRGLVSSGDRVYHWVTGPQAGLYAVSHIEGTVRQDAEVGGEVVDVRFDKVLLSPIPRASLEAIPELSGLTVPAGHRWTNRLLSLGQALALDRLCGLPERWPFEPSSLAEVLRLDPMQPELRSGKDQRKLVKSRVQGFLDLVASRVQQECPDLGRMGIREAGDVKGGRLTLARLVVPGQGGLPDLDCALGILDSSGKPSHCLFAGIALGGAGKDELETRLMDLGLLRPEDTVRISQTKAFAGRTVRVGCFLSADEVELKSPADLVDQLVGELVAWARRLREARESSAATPSLEPKDAKEEVDLVSRLEGWFEAHRLRFPRALLTTYALALQAKPFVILSGLSGTGKTKLARLFAEFFSLDPMVEEETPLAEVDVDGLFAQPVRPTLRQHRKLHIPLKAWQYFPPLDPGEKQKLDLQVGGRSVVATLHNFCVAGRPEGVRQLYLPSEAADWVGSLEVGTTLRWFRDGQGGWRLDCDTAPPRTRPTRRSQFAFVPVRPDWTDPRGLLGFAHLLTGTYQSTDFLRTLLRAWTDPGQPFFILLDEMNLARVEHYFSDFLSALESRRTRRGEDGTEHPDQDPFPLHSHPRCLLNTGEEEQAEEFYGQSHLCTVNCAGCPFEEFVDLACRRVGDVDNAAAVRAGFCPTSFTPPRLKVPWNVLFTGTVNVDETTHTFSPKVLDRSFVLEFRHVDLQGYFDGGREGRSCERARPEDLDRWTHDGTFPFVDLGRRESTRRQPALAPYRLRLAALNSILVVHDLHFGYRVADEILTFLENARLLADPEYPLPTAFDQALLMKILPRFHGSRARLGAPLLDLLTFCAEAGEEGEEQSADALAQRLTASQARFRDQPVSALADLADSAAYPGSARKILRLLRDLEEDGFAGSL